MDASAIKSETPEQTDGRGHSGKDPSLADDVKSLWHELRELNHMQLQLAALEAQQAGKSLVIMMVAGVIAAILLSVAWLGFLATAVLALSRYGILTDYILLILLTVTLNLLLVLVLWRIISSKSYYLRFPATVRSIQSMLSAFQAREEM